MAAGDVQVTIVGNIGGDPDMKFLPTGDAVTNFNVAVTPRFLDKTTNEWKDGEPSWYRCVVWRQHAENVAGTLQRGMRVVVVGRQRIRKYTDSNGVERTTVEITVDEVAPSLKYATAKVDKAERQNTGGGGGPASDPWASAVPASQGGGFGGGGKQNFPEEPPF